MPGLSLGCSYALPFGDISVPLPPDFLNLSETVEGTLEIHTDDGMTAITLVITAPAAYAGSYLLDPAVLDGGPAALVAPVLSGSGTVGAVLTAAPALWAYDADLGALSVSRAWHDTAGAIAGATGPTLLLDAAEAGTAVRCIETALQGAVATEAVSNAIAVAAAATGWSLQAGSGSVLVSAMPAPPAVPAIAGSGSGSVTLQ